MIYKIIDNSEAILKGIPELKTYNIYFVKGCLFVSDINNEDNFYQNLQSLFSQSEIILITEYNLVYEPIHIIEWAKKELVQADLIKYEKDNQEKLEQIMRQLDYVEKELFEGSEDQCQMKLRRKEEDLQKTKNKSILTKVLNRLKCVKTHSSQSL